MPPIDVTFIDEHDPDISPLGSKGIGDLGVVGVAPAIANAVFHVTGRRIRHLPTMPEDLL
jgi:xanthine dehydrogenase YagR molybdenum-binding subunit